MHLGCKGEREGETGRKENGSSGMAMGMGAVMIQAMSDSGYEGEVRGRN